MKNTLILILFFILLFLSSCKDEPVTPKPETNLFLSVEDVSCTEAWVKLTTTNLQLPTSLDLLKDDNIIKTINLQTTDTLLYIDSLLPNKIYSIQAFIHSTNQSHISSNELNVTTMDTTSHNFTFETFEFGQNIGSVLFDVAVIDENNIWAVGEIYMNDSLGNPDPQAYNAVHWDGNEWGLKKIGNQGGWACHTVFAFSATDVWFEGVIKWDGANYSVHNNGFPKEPNGDGWRINKMWGSSSIDFYVVGNNGNIAHYIGGQWIRIESGTDVDFKDIYGTPVGKELWTCGWGDGRVSLLRILENSTESIWDSQTNRTLLTYSGTLINSLYANGNREFVLVGGQVLRHSLFDKTLVKREWVPIPNGQAVLSLGNYAYRIKGSNKNNLSVAGDASMIWHFNGVTWHKFEEVYNLDDRIYGLAVQDNLIVAVGRSYGNGAGGLIKIGRRTN